MRKRTRRIIRFEIYKVFDRKGKKEVVPDPDMLRYDSCFTAEEFPTLVAFPIETTWRSVPTIARWESFWQKLVRVGSVDSLTPGDWFTYIRRGSSPLEKRNIDQIAEERNEKVAYLCKGDFSRVDWLLEEEGDVSGEGLDI